MNCARERHQTKKKKNTLLNMPIKERKKEEKTSNTFTKKMLNLNLYSCTKAKVRQRKSSQTYSKGRCSEKQSPQKEINRKERSTPLKQQQQQNAITP